MVEVKIQFNIGDKWKYIPIIKKILAQYIFASKLDTVNSSSVWVQFLKKNTA